MPFRSRERNAARRTLSLFGYPSTSARIVCKRGMRAQLRAFERDLRTTHLYLASYIAHIFPSLNDFPIIQTEHACARCLDGPRKEGSYFCRNAAQQQGATRVLDAFIQRSQICFQRREGPPELNAERGRRGTMNTVLTTSHINTTGRTSLRAHSSSSLPSRAVLLIRRNDARSCSAACSELCISD